MEENNVNNQTVQPAAPAETTAPQATATASAPKKSNVGLIIGIGCGALLLLGIIIVIIIAVVVIFASSGKKLKCTYTTSTSGCTTNIQADITFKSNRANAVTMNGYVDCSGSAYESTMLDAVESSLKKQTNVTNIKRSGSKITFDYKDQAGINLKDPANSKVGITYDEAKKQVEKAGYKCE